MILESMICWKCRSLCRKSIKIFGNQDVVTEAYYLPEKYLTEKGFVKKHPELIPIGTSEQEQKDMIDQIKADSVLLWKRK